MKKSVSGVSLSARMYRRISVSALIWLILAVTLFFLPFVPDAKLVRLKLQWLEMGIYIAFSLWLMWTCFKGEISVRYTAVYVPILLYVVYSIALYFVSPNQPVALMEVRRILLCLGVFLVSSNILTTRILQQRMVHVWLAATGMIALYGILQHYGGIGIIQVPRMDRVMGTSGNPIFFAVHLIVVVPMILSLLTIHENIFAKLYLGIVLCVVLGAVFFTKTRAAFLALILGIPLWCVLEDWLNQWALMKMIWRRKILIAGIFIGLCGIHIAGSLTNSSYNKLNTNVISFVSRLAARHQAHTVIWRDTITMWGSEPFFGKGLGTFTIYFPDYASDTLKQIWPQRNFIVNDAHNEYLQVLAETGAVGLGIFLWILASFFGIGWRTMYAPDKGENRFKDKIWTMGILVSSILLLIQNIFSVDMRFVISAAFLFLMIGMVGESEKKQYDMGSFVWLRWIVFVCACLAVAMLGKGLIEPYRAQRRLAAEPDFFEQKILEPARTKRELLELAQKYPDKASVFEKLGWVYAKEKKWNEAIQNYMQATRIDPELAGAYNNLGNIYFTMGNRSKALEYYKRALAIDATLVDAHMNAGVAYYYEGRLRESSEHIKKVIELDPKNAKARDLLKRMSE